MKKHSIIITIIIGLCLICSCDKVVLSSDDSKENNEPSTKVDPEPTDTTDSTSGGGATDSTSDDDDGTSEGGHETGDTVSVSEFISCHIGKEVFIVGYIVGTCYKNHDNTTFQPPFSHDSSILMADNPKERDPEKMIAIKLSSSLKNDFSLKLHPQNLGKKVFVFGNKKTYLKFCGLQTCGSHGFL